MAASSQLTVGTVASWGMRHSGCKPLLQSSQTSNFCSARHNCLDILGIVVFCGAMITVE